MSRSLTVESATEGQCIPAWFCANVKTGRESIVASALDSLDIETFLPLETYSTWREVTRYNPIRHSYDPIAEKQQKTRAWFPSYFFARLDDRAWAIVKTQLRRQLGAKLLPRWVDLGTGRPLSLTDAEMTELTTWCSTYCEPSPEFKKDQPLEIISGPFRGFSGLFSKNKAERVWVLMEFMGGKREMPFNLKELKPITDYATPECEGFTQYYR